MKWKNTLQCWDVQPFAVAAITAVCLVGASHVTLLAQGPATVPCKITPQMAQIPADVVGNAEAQASFDVLSWNTFIAVNWPANPQNCSADTTKSITDSTGPRVWESWALDSDIFVAPGQTPLPFCSLDEATTNLRIDRLSPDMKDAILGSGTSRFFPSQSKISASLAHSFPGIGEAFGGVLTDQNGRFVRYEKRVNLTEYNYLVKNTLWSRKGQQAFTGTIAFPPGSIEIKAAWKVLGAGDDLSRFYTIKGIVFNDDPAPPKTPSRSPGTNPVVLGLVGLHIVHKTPSQKNWIWSTFEQVDNTSKSFFNPKSNAAPNTQLAKSQNGVYTELNPDGSRINLSTQVVRVNAIVNQPAAIPAECRPTTTPTINQWYQDTLLKGSVWQNYQLVATQWLAGENVNGFKTGIRPQFLANTVLETYNQGPNPPTDGPTPFTFGSATYQPFSASISSSCMKCHSVATMPNSKKSSDFSFLLFDAQ